MKPYKQIWEAIAEDIKEDIMNGRYKPEERLKEVELAQKYSVSKTPVREALRYLESIGFVNIVPHTMVAVKKFNKKEVQNLCAIHGVLEGLAAREAVSNLDQNLRKAMERSAALTEKYCLQNNTSEYEKANFNFHSIIWKASNNENLVELLHKIYEQLQRFRSVTRRFPDRFHDLVKDHREIVEAIVQKDGAKAEQLVRRHIEKHGKIIVERLEMENTENNRKEVGQEKSVGAT